MKHPSNQEFFDYWDRKRGTGRAPVRADIEPAALRELLGDIFVLAYDAQAGFPFRVAGTRVSALLGRDLRNEGFSALFTTENRHDVEELVAGVVEDVVPAVAGVTASTETGSTAYLELLLLPFVARAHSPVSLTGLLAPFDSAPARIRDLTLTSWRFLHPKETFVPRVIRKLAIARGFMVYEGLH